MKKTWVFGILPIAIISVLFFGCDSRPGEKLYHKALAQWEAGNLGLGLLLWDMGDQQLAINSFQESLRIEEGNVDVLCNLGVALSTAQDFPAAEAAFREAALRNANDPRPLAYTGTLYAQHKKWPEAERNLQRALTRTPDDLQLQTALAITELHTQGAPAAIKRLHSILQKDPYFCPALFNMATIHRYWLGDAKQAKIWFDRYLKQSSGVDAFSEIARTQLQALEASAQSSAAKSSSGGNDRKKAELSFQKATKDHRSGNLKEAVKGYLLTIQTDRSYDRAYYNLGLAYYASGQMEKAGEAFKQAVTLDPSFVDAKYNLALVYHYHLNKPADALKQLESLLVLKPTYKPAIELLARIKKP